MCYFPPSDRGSRKAPPRRVRPLVCRHSAQARRRTLGWRLPIRSRALALSPHTAALARPLTHRKWLKQRGHFSFSTLRRSHSNNIKQYQTTTTAAAWERRSNVAAGIASIFKQRSGDWTYHRLIRRAA